MLSLTLGCSLIQCIQEIQCITRITVLREFLYTHIVANCGTFYSQFSLNLYITFDNVSRMFSWKDNFCALYIQFIVSYPLFHEIHDSATFFYICLAFFFIFFIFSVVIMFCFLVFGVIETTFVYHTTSYFLFSAHKC